MLQRKIEILLLFFFHLIFSGLILQINLMRMIESNRMNSLLIFSHDIFFLNFFNRTNLCINSQILIWFLRMFWHNTDPLTWFHTIFFITTYLIHLYLCRIIRSTKIKQNKKILLKNLLTIRFKFVFTSSMVQKFLKNDWLKQHQTIDYAILNQH